MSTFIVDQTTSEAIIAASPGVLRLPTENLGPPGAATRQLVYTPDLTPAEQVIFDDLLSVIQSAIKLTSAEYAAVRTQMQILRTLRQNGRNAYVGLTEAERNRQTYDALIALLEINLILLRD